MIYSKYIDVKRHSVYFPEIEKTFAVSSLVLNLFASQIGEFLLPHHVHGVYTHMTHSVPWNKIFLLYVLRSVAQGILVQR